MKKIAVFLLLLTLSSLFSASVSGFVSDAKNGERLSFVTVMLKGTQSGGYTNKEGYFVISKLVPGKYELIVQYMGYSPKSIPFELKSTIDNYFVKIEIKKQSVEIEGFDVNEKKFDLEINAREVVIANIRQTTDDIQNVSQIAEADVFRSLQMLPGVSSINDYSSGLYVRGGSADQNLILLDEIDVYNPNHFGGIFSTFNTDAIQNVSLLKGGFGSQYGGRLSSVLDISNLDGNRKFHEGIFRTSLISSSATVQGPWKIAKTGGSYMASFRRTYLDLIGEIIDLPDYYFYDGHTKLNWDLSSKDKLQTSFYFGKDKLAMDIGSKLDISWGNETASTQWIHVVNPQLFTHSIFATSHFGSEFFVESTGDEYFKRQNDIYDFTFKEYISYTPNSKHVVDFGSELKINDVKFVFSTNSDADPNSLPDVSVRSYIGAIYLQDTWTIGKKWTIVPGLRFTLARAVSNYLEGKPQADYHRVSPRFTVRYNFSETGNLYANYGRYYQYLTSVNPGISSPFDLWFPIDKTVKPQESDHYIVGIKKQINEELIFDLEAYYKDYRKLVDYNPEADFTWNNETGTLSDIYNTGDGYSYGLDFLLRNDWKFFEGFAGYTYGITKRKLENVNIDPDTNEEQWFFPQYDQTHQVNFVQNFRLSEATGFTIGSSGMLTLGLTYAFKTGQPYEKPEQFYFDGSQINFLYSYSDRHRLPNYTRTDFSLKCRFDKPKYSIEPYIQLINVFDHKNIWTINYIGNMMKNPRELKFKLKSLKCSQEFHLLVSQSNGKCRNYKKKRHSNRMSLFFNVSSGRRKNQHFFFSKISNSNLFTTAIASSK